MIQEAMARKGELRLQYAIMRWGHVGGLPRIS